MTERVSLRVWVPDEPGALAALAQRVADAGANVIGLEVLERAGAAALDELLVEVTAADDIDGLCLKVAALPGARIEEVRPVDPETTEHSLAVVEAAVAILTASQPRAGLAVLADAVARLFDADWCTLEDPADRSVAHRAGGVAPPDRIPPGRGLGVEVVSVTLEETGLTLWTGRPIPFRPRELREIEMLARAADRTCRPARLDRIPPQWGSKGTFPGS